MEVCRISLKSSSQNSGYLLSTPPPLTAQQSKLHVLFQRRAADDAAEVVSHCGRLGGPGCVDTDVVKAWKG